MAIVRDVISCGRDTRWLQPARSVSTFIARRATADRDGKACETLGLATVANLQDPASSHAPTADFQHISSEKHDGWLRGCRRVRR